MFYARIENSGEFKRVLDVVKDIVPTVNLKISDSGISFDANESFYVIQVKLKLPIAYFSEFKCEGLHSLGLSLQDLSTLIKLGQPTDSLILQYTEGQTTLTISLEAAIVPTIAIFSLNLISVKADDCVYVEVSNAAKFEMNAKLLHQTCHDLSQVSEFLKISVNKLRVKFSVDSDLVGGSINLKQIKGENGTLIQTPRTINTEVNLVYAKRITRAHWIAERVEVRLYDNEPVVFAYKFDTAEVKFYLAPAICE